MEAMVAPVDTTGLVGGLGEQYSEVKRGSFILRRKEKIFSRQNDWFPLPMEYLFANSPFFFFGFV